MAPEEAIAELDRCAGTQFDPCIVTALAEELGLDEISAEPIQAAALAS